MIFKVTFVDGSVEMVHAGTPAEARLYATRQFRDRVAVKVERGGLTDMMNPRAQGGHAETANSGKLRNPRNT
jgi:hypothetical protein